MQFMVTPAFQNTIPTGNWMYPVIKTDLPAGFASLSVPKTTLQFSPEEVASHRSQWVSQWQRAVSR
jgi:thiamine transport system substrate-binding protein